MILKKLSVYMLILSFFVASCDKKEDQINPFKKRVEDKTGSTPPSSGNDAAECPTGSAGQPVAGQYIVFFKNETVSTESFGSYSSAKEFIKSKSAQLLQKYGIQNQNVNQVFAAAANGFAARISEDKVQMIKDDPEVLAVEQDRFVALEPLNVDASADSAAQVLPWGVKRIGCGVGQGTSRTAWVLDTGIDPAHPDLNVDVARSVSFVCAEPTPDDKNGHGTHVAGTIAAIDNKIGVVGVAPGNSVVGVKVMGSDGKGTISNLLAGLDYVYRNGAPGDVINMSLSGGMSTNLDNMVLKIANEKKIYFALASGNESKDAMNLSPQRLSNPYVFTVSAMDSEDSFATFSNFGQCVTFAAPGVKIASTYPGGKYVYMSGTSMAAPHVAGLILLNGGVVRSDGTVKNDPDGKPDPIAHK